MAQRTSHPKADAVKGHPSCKVSLANGLKQGKFLAIHKSSRWYQKMTGEKVKTEKSRKFYDNQLTKYFVASVMEQVKEARKTSEFRISYTSVVYSYYFLIIL